MFYKKYERLRDAGIQPEKVYQVMITDGLDEVQRIKGIRQTFNLPLAETKRVSVRSIENDDTLIAEQQQAGLIKTVEWLGIQLNIAAICKYEYDLFEATMDRAE